jgi:DNA polymerase-3 subunit epsilon
MREIVFDTETTGLDPGSGHRVVEIGCVEILNGIPTGKHFHCYLNPERDVPQEVVNVHGLTTEFLSDKPLFAEVVGDFLEFIGTDPMIAHNANFDMAFIDAELTRVGFPVIAPSRITDSLLLARKAFPGAPCSLDALCKRFNVDASARNLHGALLDARLLAEVYLELRGGRQREITISFTAKNGLASSKRKLREARPHAASDEEIAEHEAAIAKLKETLWKTA